MYIKTIVKYIQYSTFICILPAIALFRNSFAQRSCENGHSENPLVEVAQTWRYRLTTYVFILVLIILILIIILVVREFSHNA